MYVRLGMLITAVAAALAGVLTLGGSDGAEDSGPSVSLAPLTNSTSDPSLDWLRTGIPEMLVGELSEYDIASSVLVEPLDGRTTPNLVQQARIKKDTHSARGRFDATADQLLFDVELFNGMSGISTLFRIEVPRRDPFEAVRRVAAQIHSEVVEAPTISSATIAASVRLPSGATARNAYEMALDLISKGAEGGSIPHLVRVISEDASFAPAYARLASAYRDVGDMEAARATVERARQNVTAHELDTPHRLRLEAAEAITDLAPERATSILGALARSSPSDAFLWYDLGIARELNGDVSGAIEAFRQALTASPEFGGAVLGLGRNYVRNFELDRAVRVVNDGISENVLARDDRTMGMAHSILGVSYARQGKFDAASKAYTLSLHFRERADDRRGTVITLDHLSHISIRLGNITKARAFVDKAHVLAASTGNDMLIAFAALSRGNLFVETGDFSEAEGDYKKALEIERKRKFLHHVPLLMDSLALTFHAQGEHTHSMVFLRRARNLLSKYHDPREIRANAYVTGLVYRDQVHFDAAAREFGRAIQAPRQGFAAGMPNAVLELAKLDAARGDFRAALEVLDEMTGDLKQHVGPIWIARAAFLRSRTYARLGAQSEAVAAFPLVSDHFAGELQAAQIDRLLTKAHLASLDGEDSQAAALMEFCLATKPATEEPWARLDAAVFLSEIYLRQKNWSLALDLSQQTAKRARAKRRMPIYASALTRSASALIGLGKTAEALAHLEEAKPIAQRIGHDAVLLGEIQALRRAALSSMGRIEEASTAGRDALRICQAILENIHKLELAHHTPGCKNGNFDFME